MKTIDHSERRSPAQIATLEYPHKCKCGTVIRNEMAYRTHHNCSEQ